MNSKEAKCCINIVWRLRTPFSIFVSKQKGITMNNSGWITDRLPNTSEITNEGDVWVYDVDADEYLIRNYEELVLGQPWREIDPPPSYVKPKRFEVRILPTGYAVYDITNGMHEAYTIPTRKAAERIAAIYDEVMNAQEANYQQNKETDK